MNLSKIIVIASITASVVMFQACNQPSDVGGIAEVKKEKNELVKNNIAEESTVTEANAGVISMPANFTIAYVNTDSLMANYEFYKDASKEIQLYEASIQKKYEYRARKLKEDYDGYIEKAKAGMLTLKQQQDTEASLQNQQQELLKMEQSLGQESAMQRQVISTTVTDTILSFLNNYRSEKNYTLILNYGSMSGLLSADPQLDITDDVITRLNAKYTFDKRHQ